MIALRFVWVVVGFLTGAVSVIGAELSLPGVGTLPVLEKSWVVREQASTGTGAAGASWIILTNTQSGEILSLGAERRATPFGEAHSAWSNMAGDVFSRGGDAVWKKSGPPPFVAHWIRNNVVVLSSREGERIVSRKALQYTLIFEPQKSKEPNLMSHGYAFACGSRRVFVQHTSKAPITDEQVQSLALHFVLKCGDKPPMGDR